MLIATLVAGAALAFQAQGTSDVLPAPTGPHKTGRQTFHWKDTRRDELETKAPGDKRELMVHVFYPADAGASGARAPYLPDAGAMRIPLGPWSEAQVARIAGMRAYSIANAPLPRGTARYPVIVFQPGGGMKGLSYHALFEDLASHGWVVAVIDPPYNARAVRLADGRVLGYLAAEERGWPESRNRNEEISSYRARVVHMARDISFVIDQLAALDRGSGGGPFAKRLDLQRGVGTLGHSRGGQAAATARILDTRVRGGINLDGTAGEFGGIIPAKGGEEVGAQPFLWIQKTLPPPPTAEQLQRARRARAEYDVQMQQMLSAWNRRLANVSGGALRVHMLRPDIDHIDFSDEPFWDGHMTAATRPGKLQTIADTRVWVRAFFDGTIRGDWASLKRLASAGKTRRQETVTVFRKPWPQ